MIKSATQTTINLENVSSNIVKKVSIVGDGLFFDSVMSDSWIIEGPEEEGGGKEDRMKRTITVPLYSLRYLSSQETDSASRWFVGSSRSRMSG